MTARELTPDPIDQVIEKMKRDGASGEPRLALDPDAPTPPRRTRGPRKIAADKEEAEKQAAAERSAKFLEGASEMLYSVWLLALSLAASRRVEFSESESPVVKDALVRCAQQYLPGGWVDHAPLVSLVSMSMVAVLRARAHPQLREASHDDEAES